MINGPIRILTTSGRINRENGEVRGREQIGFCVNLR